MPIFKAKIRDKTYFTEAEDRATALDIFERNYQDVDPDMVVEITVLGERVDDRSSG